MRTVSYTASALRDLKRHGNVAGRVRKALAEYAADPQAHANNVTQLVGSPFQCPAPIEWSGQNVSAAS